MDLATYGTRKRQLKLTNEGIETYKYAEQLWEKVQSYIVDYLGKNNLEIFTTILSKIQALVP